AASVISRAASSRSRRASFASFRFSRPAPMNLRLGAAAMLAAASASGPLPAAADSTENATDVLRLALPAAAFALTVRRDDDDGRRQFYRSFGANVLATWALKEAFDKKRPDGTGDDAF